MYLFFWSLGGLFWWFNSCTSWPSLLPLIEQLYSQILAMIFILHGLHKNCEFKMNQFGSRYICYCRTPVSGPSYFGDFKIRELAAVDVESEILIDREDSRSRCWDRLSVTELLVEPSIERRGRAAISPAILMSLFLCTVVFSSDNIVV
nr:uncharacterized protein LOC117274592 isoform X1 [Nicotiana tomentosiformis]